MAENQIQKLNHTHERIMDWLVQNPEKSLRECSQHFNYSQAWLSTVINSDAFRAKLAALHGEVHARVANDVPARMARIADVVLDRLATVVEHTDNPDFLLEVGDSILTKMGYGGKSSAPATPVQNNFTINVNDLASARAQLLSAQSVNTIEQSNDNE